VGGKGGCKVVPRNFLSVLKHYIQISITIASPLSHLTSPSPRLPSSVSHPPPPPLPPQNFLIHTPTFRTPPSISSHLIPSHPIPSIPRPSYILYAAHHPSYLLSSISYTPTQLYIYAPTPSHLLIHPASSLIFPHISRSCTRSRSLAWCAISVVRVAWVGRFWGWYIGAGKEGGGEGGVGACMVKNGR